MPRSRCLLPILAMLAATATTTHAAAQSAGFAVNRLEPSERGSDWFVSESLDLRGRARPLAGIVGDWSYRPLVLRENGERKATIIADDVVMHVGGGMVFADRFRAAFSLPVALYRDGDDLAGLSVAARAPASDATIGDVRLAFDAGLFGDYGDLVHVAVGSQVHLPTGSREAYTSDGTVRVAPRILVAGDRAAFAYAVKVGFQARPFDGVYEGRRLGSEAFFSVSGGVKVNDRVIFGPELYGSTVVTNGDAFAARATPIGGLLGMRVILLDDLRFGNAIGTGFGRGDGDPDFRVLASLEYAPDVCVDKDGDGICEKDDACPLVFGIRTRVRSTNGCPVARPVPEQPTPEPPKEPPDPSPSEPAPAPAPVPQPAPEENGL